MSSAILKTIATLTLAAHIGMAGAVSPAEGAEREPTRVTVFDTVLNPVEDRLFGQFMERASWGEPGYDAARDPRNPRALQAAVIETLAWLNIPVVRWPAGADLTQIDCGT